MLAEPIVYVNQTIMLYILIKLVHPYSNVCQFFLNKTGKKKISSGSHDINKPLVLKVAKQQQGKHKRKEKILYRFDKVRIQKKLYHLPVAPKASRHSKGFRSLARAASVQNISCL